MTFRSTVIHCRELITVHISPYAYIIKLQLYLLTMTLVRVLSFKCMPSEDGLYGLIYVTLNGTPIKIIINPSVMLKMSHIKH
jgi:hypothetical protein